MHPHPSRCTTDCDAHDVTGKVKEKYYSARKMITNSLRQASPHLLPQEFYSRIHVNQHPTVSDESNEQNYHDVDSTKL
jgi:hypothetical protein